MRLLLFLLYASALSFGLARRGLRSAPGRVGTAPGVPPSRVLIVGATGGTGRHLVEQALDRGYTVTAMARAPSAMRIEHPRLTVVQGDVLDAQSVDAAMRGQDAVVSALGHKKYLWPTRILSDGTGTLLRAMEAHRVTRFVCVTSLGLGDSVWRLGLFYSFFLLPIVLPFYFWDKARQERVIAASRVDWVIVRPGALTNGPRRGLLRHGPDVGSVVRTVRISRADTAAFVLDQLTDNTYLGAAARVAW